MSDSIGTQRGGAVLEPDVAPSPRPEVGLNSAAPGSETVGQGYVYAGKLLPPVPPFAGGRSAGSEAQADGSPGESSQFQPEGRFDFSRFFKRSNLSTLLEGINITPNMLFLLLFLGMAMWLYVVYWVRHNEPLANQVLGSEAISLPGSHADRRIVEGIRKAVPIRTSQGGQPAFVSDSPAAAPGALDTYGGAVALPSGTLPLQPAPYSHQSLAQHPVVAPASVPSASWHGAYHVPVHSADGLRLKTITNR